jgi:hypothetical protein
LNIKVVARDACGAYFGPPVLWRGRLLQRCTAIGRGSGKLDDIWENHGLCPAFACGRWRKLGSPISARDDTKTGPQWKGEFLVRSSLGRGDNERFVHRPYVFPVLVHHADC